MKQGVQTDATCNIQQCRELLANTVASVCTGHYNMTDATKLILLKYKFLSSYRDDLAENSG